MSDLVAHWRALYKAGYSLVPLQPHGKKSLVPWAEYQKARATAEVIKGWLAFWPGCNPGVITGKLSRAIVLDIDGDEGMASIASLELPGTAVVRTARGWHYYFMYPDLEEGQRVVTKAGVLPGVDSRGDGGYVVGPGSIHETGAVYEWADETRPILPAPQWWLDLVVTTTPDPYAVSDAQYTPRQTDGMDDKRARGYVLAALKGEVAKVETATDGTKHDRLLSSAIALGGLVPYLEEYEIEGALFNAIAPRAADKHAARKTIRDGIDYGVRRPREIPEPKERPPADAGRYTSPPPPPTGDTPTEGAPKVDRWQPIPVTELVANEERVPWYLHGYIAPGMYTQLTGLWKAGKSSWLGHVYAKLGEAEGEFAGLPTTGCKVLVVSEEAQSHWITRRDELRLGAHIHLLCKPFLANPDKTAWGAFIARIAELVALHDYGLVVFDSLPNLWAVKDENDAAQVREAVTPLNALTELGAGVVLVCHPSKGDMTEGRATRGSGLLSSFVDIIVEMRRLEPDNADDTRRIFKSYSRFTETPSELVLEYTAGFGYEARGNKHDAEREARKWALQSILPTEAPGATIDELLEEWPENERKPAKGTLRADLGYLCAQSPAYLRTGRGTRQDVHRYYYAQGNERWDYGRTA